MRPSVPVHHRFGFASHGLTEPNERPKMGRNGPGMPIAIITILLRLPISGSFLPSASLSHRSPQLTPKPPAPTSVGILTQVLPSQGIDCTPEQAAESTPRRPKSAMSPPPPYRILPLAKHTISSSPPTTRDL